jgi:hypothetical protein
VGFGTGLRHVSPIAFPFRLAVFPLALLVSLPLRLEAQLLARDIVQTEVDRCERNMKAVRVEIGNRYEKRLSELRAVFQKAGDLEGALAVRAEEQRALAEPERPLESRHLVEEPRSLKELQTELLSKQSEMIAQIVLEAVPKLVEMKKNLTVAGKLDEAVEVRSAIQRLQDATSPAQRLAAGAQVSAEEVYQAYQSSKERADKIYRGVKVLLRGRVAGVRPDPREPGALTLVLFGGVEGALVDCAFPIGEYRVREERQGQGIVYVVAHGNNDSAALRVSRGAWLSLRAGATVLTAGCDSLDVGCRGGEAGGGRGWVVHGALRKPCSPLARVAARAFFGIELC